MTKQPEQYPINPVTVQGTPLTEEMKAIFSFFGDLSGLVAEANGTITATYSNGVQIVYYPVFRPDYSEQPLECTNDS